MTVTQHYDSAGVGRTGTFCTIHIMIQQYKFYLKKLQELGIDSIQVCFIQYNAKAFRVVLRKVIILMFITSLNN